MGARGPLSRGLCFDDLTDKYPMTTALCRRVQADPATKARASPRQKVSACISRSDSTESLRPVQQSYPRDGYTRSQRRVVIDQVRGAFQPRRRNRPTSKRQRPSDTEPIPASTTPFHENILFYLTFMEIPKSLPSASPFSTFALFLWKFLIISCTLTLTTVRRTIRLCRLAPKHFSSFWLLN